MNQTQRIPLLLLAFITVALFDGCQSPENENQKPNDSISKEDLTKTLVAKDTMIRHPNGYLDGEFEEYPYGTPDKKLRDMASMGFYSQVLYDKFRNVYYRLYLGPTPEEERHRKDLRVMHYRPPTMYIYDHNYSIIGETGLPANSHFLYDYFVAEEGLYLTTTTLSKKT